MRRGRQSQTRRVRVKDGVREDGRGVRRSSAGR